MKTRYLTLLALVCSCGTLWAQWLSNGTKIYYNNGNIGIGTIDPSTKLEVVGETKITNGSNLEIALSTPGGKNGIAFNVSQYSNYSRFDMVNYNNATVADRYFHFKFNTDATGLAIRKGGNVAIGTTSPVAGYKLTVDGGIIAEKIKVAVSGTANWSDYVFKSDYKLRPLHEVETFVKENQHLPGIPSAGEMVKEGLDVAQMDAKLLEKIEELTLYVIELNKKVVKLEAENALLQSNPNPKK